MISKKDLLKEMNISYGQLYRWKREGLIPDEWFIKQSVSTGQETFFKRSLIIPRIKEILSLKDKYELQEINKLFTDKNEEHNYNVREVVMIDEIDPFVLKTYLANRKQLTIIELALVYIFSQYKDLIDINDYLSIDFNDNRLTDKNVYICNLSDQNFILIGDDNLVIDSKIKIINIEKLHDVISLIAVKIKEV